MCVRARVDEAVVAWGAVGVVVVGALIGGVGAASYSACWVWRS